MHILLLESKFYSILVIQYPRKQNLALYIYISYLLQYADKHQYTALHCPGNKFIAWWTFQMLPFNGSTIFHQT
jgi:hypothetical protein